MFRVLDVGAEVLQCHILGLLSLTLLSCQDDRVNTLYQMFGSSASVFASETTLPLQGVKDQLRQEEEEASAGSIDVRRENIKLALEPRFPKLVRLGIGRLFVKIGLRELPRAFVRLRCCLYEAMWHDKVNRIKCHCFLTYAALDDLRYSLDMHPNVLNICTSACLRHKISRFYNIVRRLGRGSDEDRSKPIPDAREIIQFYIDFDHQMFTRGGMLCTDVPGERQLSFCEIGACEWLANGSTFQRHIDPLLASRSSKRACRCPFPCSFCVPKLPSYPRIDCFYKSIPLEDNKVPKQRFR